MSQEHLKSEAEIMASAQRLRSAEFGRIMSRAAAGFRSLYGDLGTTMEKARLANRLVAMGERRLADIGLTQSDIASVFSDKQSAAIVKLGVVGAEKPKAKGEQAAA